MVIFHSYVKLPEGNRTDIKVLLMPISHHHGDSFCWRATPKYSLVGGLNPSEKYEFVSWDDYSQYMEN